jgi:DNA polymerase III subunit delta
MIFFFYGDNSFLAQQKINALKDKFKNTIDPSGHNIQYLDGENLSIDDFFKTVSASGFLASKKLVTIRNIFQNKNLKKFQDCLIAYLEKQQDSVAENYLIFWEDNKADAKTKLFKTLKKFKYTEEFKVLLPNKLILWAKQQFQNFQKDIAPDALETLLSYIGNNLWQLDQEIKKLINFSQTNLITDEDVKSLIQAKANDNIFSLVDAIGRKDKAQSLKLLEEQLTSGSNAIYILTMVIRQFRLLLKIKILSARIKNNFALAQTMKIHSFVAQKTLAQSKLYSLEELKAIYQKLLLLDEKLKTSAWSEKIILTQMINNL